jgi:hypothetical protein
VPQACLSLFVAIFSKKWKIIAQGRRTKYPYKMSYMHDNTLFAVTGHLFTDNNPTGKTAISHGSLQQI